MIGLYLLTSNQLVKDKTVKFGMSMRLEYRWIDYLAIFSDSKYVYYYEFLDNLSRKDIVDIEHEILQLHTNERNKLFQTEYFYCIDNKKFHQSIIGVIDKRNINYVVHDIHDFDRKKYDNKPDICVPDIVEPDIFEPDICVPDICVPDIFEPDIFEPDIYVPDIYVPDICVPDICVPDICVPDICVPDIFEPVIFEPDIFEPVIFEPNEIQIIRYKPHCHQYTEEEVEYNYVKELNKELNIQSKEEYFDESIKLKHIKYIDEPEKYFKLKGVWINWYDFRGTDTKIFIQDKQDWITFCKEKNVQTLSEYYKLCESHDTLPRDPCDFYNDFSNIINELGINIYRKE